MRECSVPVLKPAVNGIYKISQPVVCSEDVINFVTLKLNYVQSISYREYALCTE